MLIEYTNSIRNSLCYIENTNSNSVGNTINLAHLIPFVKISRQRIIVEVKAEAVEILNSVGEQIDITTNLDDIVEERLKKEIADGIQTIQYQLITISTTNGQAPFTSIFMYLNDVDEDSRHDYAMVIEEVLRQRIKGVKNEKGVYITTAFPKLLYVLDENNIHENSEYWYLTKLAAECSTKRLVPDYISAKKMRELKGDVYGCMGKRIAHVKPCELLPIGV